MPRKTKEQKELENQNKTEKVSKKTTKKATTVTKKTVSKTTTKKPSTKKTATSKTSSSRSVAKKDAKKSSSTTKSKATTSKKTATKTTTTKKGTKSTKTTKKVASKKEKVQIVEYYDLPYRYNQTVVKLLYQSPTTLFIYWDISDDDRKNFQEQYGENFFEITKPILIIHNNTLGYSFEIDINDFANSWYLHVSDSKCDYKIELGRRPIIKTETLNTDYIYISTSNQIESPNDRILFDNNQKMVYFRNVKTSEESTKDISSLSFIRNMGHIYNIYDLYKAMYNEQDIEDIYNLSNPSSSSKLY